MHTLQSAVFAIYCINPIFLDHVLLKLTFHEYLRVMCISNCWKLLETDSVLHVATVRSLPIRDNKYAIK